MTHVYAAGDVANFPVKHGGLAAQQADAAAEAMLAELGLPIVPRPFDPVIQGVLFTDDEPAYLQARLARDEGRAVGAALLFAVVAAEQDRRPAPLAVPGHPRRRAADPGDAPRWRRGSRCRSTRAPARADSSPPARAGEYGRQQRRS